MSPPSESGQLALLRLLLLLPLLCSRAVHCVTYDDFSTHPQREGGRQLDGSRSQRADSERSPRQDMTWTALANDSRLADYGGTLPAEVERGGRIGSQAHRPHRIRHRKSDDDQAQRNEGVYQVLDRGAELRGHKHPPSCIVLRGRAKLVIPLSLENRAVHNKTIVVPSVARTIGACGEHEQWITLLWNNTKSSGKLVKTAQLTLLFRKVKEESAIYLTHVWSSIALFVEDDSRTITSSINASAQDAAKEQRLGPNATHPAHGATGGQTSGYLGTQSVIMSIKNATLWRTPFRFAYVCYSRLELTMQAITLPIQSTQAAELIIDPILNDKAYLVFDEVKVEAFRRARFTPHLTHLQYDCQSRWAYNCVPVAVLLLLLLSVGAVLAAFRHRTQLGFTGHLKGAGRRPESGTGRTESAN